MNAQQHGCSRLHEKIFQQKKLTPIYEFIFAIKAPNIVNGKTDARVEGFCQTNCIKIGNSVEAIGAKVLGFEPLHGHQSYCTPGTDSLEESRLKYLELVNLLGFRNAD